MKRTDLTDEQIDALEQLIDKTDPLKVLQAISDICFAKSEHIRENWQDSVTAGWWARLSDRIQRCAKSRAP